ncbi:TorF family putative porin [Kordiimonas aquimaris]|uniref:TorF family putative porin n=1 Tax=Kordiimonas aquimaris TaxID=707591 RepID=UPI0021CF2AF6|nr:TorF family putative porin [Kordiimonas aquimaris]
MVLLENTKTRRVFLAFMFISLPVDHAVAQNQAALTLTGSATLTTDYRFRGLSLSNKDTALQGSFSLSHESGFYISTWGSSIESFNGAELELDIYGGHAGQIGNLSTNVGFYAYTYPGATDNTDYYEVFGSLGGTVKNTSWTLGTNYAFDQDGTGNQDNIYIYLSTSTPIGTTPFTVTGNIAYEDGAFGTNKWDWLLGFSYSFNRFSLSVNYIDTANTNSSAGSAGVVGMLSASF